MQTRVYQYMKKHQMFRTNDRVVAAVSGGADSVCLFVLLAGMAERGEISLRALHVHHGLRDEEADRDAQFTENLCKKYGIPCLIVRKQVAEIARAEKLSVEEAGRKARYEALEAYAKAWDEEAADGRTCRIATAHHQGDQAETILYHMFRGSGLRGLSGMAPVRQRIIRPLLGVKKEEILDFLRREQIDWVEDSTNKENHYMRNRIRNELLPWVEEHVNAEAQEHIASAGEWIAGAEEFLEYSAKMRYNDVVKVIQREKDHGVVHDAVLIQKEPFVREHPALRAYLIRMALEQVCGSFKDMGRVHVEAVLELFDKQVGRERYLPEGVRARRVYEGVLLENPKEGADERIGRYEFSCFSYEKGMQIPENRYTKWFDYDKIQCTVSVRHRKTGDFITISGGRRKSVKEYMIHEKIPREYRDRIELVADGSHILWIVGYRISEMYKVTEDTKRILQIQFYGGTEDGR